MQKKNLQLNKNWKYIKASDKTDAVWKPAIVPGNIHLDLLANQEIDDPYYRTNEKNQQWIGETDWEYCTEFDADDELLKYENIDIIFEGLDTYADAYLNDHHILKADNMYCDWRININSYIKTGKNLLRCFWCFK